MAVSLVRLQPERIAMQIMAQDLKRYWVAAEAGIHKTTLRRWLSRRIARAKWENVAKVASVLGTSVSEISTP